MCMGATMIMGLRPVFAFIEGLDVKYPILHFADSSSAIQLSQMDLTTRNMKHVAIRLAYLQHIVGVMKVLLPFKVDGTYNLADLGTKILHLKSFTHYANPLSINEVSRHMKYRYWTRSGAGEIRSSGGY